MEKSLGNGLSSTERPSIHSRGRILIKYLLVLVLLASLLSISGSKSIPSALSKVFPPNRIHPTSHPIETSTSSENEFQLVEVHRAGVGKNRNQVYQILDVPSTSLLHTSSPFSHQKFIIPSTLRKSTHLQNQ